MQIDLEKTTGVDDRRLRLVATGRGVFCQRARLALLDGSIWPAFQPIVELRSRDVVGFEILARWTDLEEGSIPPDQFISRFEEYNLIDGLTERLLNVAARQLGQLDADRFIAINIAPKQLLRADLPERMVAICEAAGIAPHRIEVEVTENSLMRDPASSLATLRAIDRLGMKISIDDFGTGYSSLSRLESFPFHKLKIDAQFVRGIDVDPSRRRIAAAVIGLGQSLGISVVAEGIETPEQARIVGELGCAFGQGWLFGRPTAAANLKIAPLQTDGLDSLPIDRSPFQRYHQLQTLYDQAPVGLCYMDLQYRYVQVNDLFASMHGKHANDILGKPIDQVLDGELLERVRTILDAARNTREPLNNIFDIDGRIFRILGNQVQDISGEMIGFSFVSLDITEQVDLIRAREERDQHHRRLIELGPNVNWSADGTGKVDYMSPLRDSTSNESMDDRIARWYARMHPEDASRVRTTWLAHLPSGKPFQTTFRIRWEDGEYREVLSRAVPHRDERDQTIRWYGVISEMPD